MVSRFGSYKEVVDSVQKLRNNSNKMTGRESDLIEELYDLIIEDKGYKVVSDIFKNNLDLNRLIHKINNQITQLTIQINEIDSKLERAKTEDDFVNREKLLDKIGKLEKLKTKVLEFINSNNNSVDEKSKKLLSLSLFSLSSGFFELDDYFGVPLGNFESVGTTKISLNDDVIDRVYRLINDDQFISQLQYGVGLVKENSELSKLNTVCSKALDLKSVVYNNLDNIFVYNLFNNQLRDIEDELQDEKYNDLELKLKILDRKIARFDSFELAKVFKKKDLEKLLEQKDDILELIRISNKLKDEKKFLENEIKLLTSDLEKNSLGFIRYIRINNDYDSLSLENNIGSFYNKDDVDDYFTRIIQTKHKCTFALEGRKTIQEDFVNNADSRVLDLLRNDFVTANNIVKLSKRGENGGITPKFALLILKTISTLQNTNINNMGVTSEQYNKVKSYYINEINDNYSKFNKAYNQIIYFGDSDILGKKK